MKGQVVEEEFIGTNVLSHLEIPLRLPELTVDQNLLGSLRIFGIFLYLISGGTALGFIGWAIARRSERVVKVAQPVFLIMIAFGTFMMSSAIIPLSIDDGGDEDSLTEAKRE